MKGASKSQAERMREIDFKQLIVLILAKLDVLTSTGKKSPIRTACLLHNAHDYIHTTSRNP